MSSQSLDRVDVLLAALSELGLSVPRPAAERMIEEWVVKVAAAMGVDRVTARSELSYEAMAGMAHRIAEQLADEAPGADLFEAERTAAVAIQTLGRVTAGLGEAILIAQVADEGPREVGHRIGQIARCLSLLGTITTSQPTVGGDLAHVLLPGGLLNRIARQLEIAAATAEEGVAPAEFPGDPAALARTFRGDADLLRAIAAEAPALAP